MRRSWGRVIVGTRLEKQVADRFLPVWSLLITKGLRNGDGWMIETGKVAHKAANALVRRFLLSDADSLFLLDSDADIGPNFLSEFRDWEPGKEYDALQAFYCQRGWPPASVWFKRSGGGQFMRKLLVAGQHDDITEDVALVGTHCALFRREIFETMCNSHPEVPIERFDWFYYPRHNPDGEDTALSLEAGELGYRLGATTHVKAGHISSVVTGWETYQDYIQVSGVLAQAYHHTELLQALGAFVGKSSEELSSLMARGLDSDIWKGVESASQAREFYGTPGTQYLIDLLAWNTTETYQELLKDLQSVRDKRVLVVGPGLGSEIAVLKDRNHVDTFELPGALREFQHFRFPDVFQYKPARLADVGFVKDYYDLVVMIDVVEHIHPDEFDEEMEWISTAARHGAIFYFHNQFGMQDKYPMHYNNSIAFERWTYVQGLEKVKVTQSGAEIWRKP